MTAYDELQLDTLGDKKTALFLIMSDTDATFNFLISMIYTQLFNLLCEKADDVYGGRLIFWVTLSRGLYCFMFHHLPDTMFFTPAGQYLRHKVKDRIRLGRADRIPQGL